MAKQKETPEEKNDKKPQPSLTNIHRTENLTEVLQSILDRLDAAGL